MNPIRQKIQELVPEIMKLQYGCKVRLEHPALPVTEAIYLTFGEYTPENPEPMSTSFHTVYSNEYGLISNLQEKALVILGSPVTLSVVLEAIKRANKWQSRYSSISHMFGDIAWWWDKNRDDLDRQEDKVVMIIGKLLEV